MTAFAAALILAQTPVAKPAQIQVTPFVPVVVFRTEASSLEEAKRPSAEREARLKAQGYALVPAEGVRVYAAPDVLQSSALRAVNALLKRLSFSDEGKPIRPDELDAEGRQALVEVLGRSPFGEAFRNGGAGGLVVAPSASVSVSLTHEGRKFSVTKFLGSRIEEDSRPTFPQALPPVETSERLVVETLGPAMPGGYVDETVAKAFAALGAKRKEAREALKRAIQVAGQRALAPLAANSAPRRLSELPGDLQKALAEDMEHNFAVRGFKTADEALNALSLGTIASIHYGVDLVVRDVQAKAQRGFTLETVRF